MKKQHIKIIEDIVEKGIILTVNSKLLIAALVLTHCQSHQYLLLSLIRLQSGTAFRLKHVRTDHTLDD